MTVCQPIHDMVDRWRPETASQKFAPPPHTGGGGMLSSPKRSTDVGGSHVRAVTDPTLHRHKPTRTA